MGREVLVNPQVVEQHISELSTSISKLREIIEMDRNEGANDTLTSIVKLHSIITEFEGALEKYAHLAELDNEHVTLIKNQLIEEDNRIVDLRLFTKP